MISDDVITFRFVADVRGNIFVRTISPESLIIIASIIGHFTIVCLVTWPWIGSEAGVDLDLTAFHM